VDFQFNAVGLDWGQIINFDLVINAGGSLKGRRLKAKFGRSTILM